MTAHAPFRLAALLAVAAAAVLPDRATRPSGGRSPGLEPFIGGAPLRAAGGIPIPEHFASQRKRRRERRRRSQQ